jgi:hypothetical protein
MTLRPFLFVGWVLVFATARFDRFDCLVRDGGRLLHGS